MVYRFYRRGVTLLVELFLAIMGSLFGLEIVDRQRAGAMEVSSETDPGESSPTIEESCARVAACNTMDDVQHGFSVEVSQSLCQSTYLRDL